MNNLIWYLFAGTRGGETRARIIFNIKNKPMNVHQLSKHLNMDYKTIQHHIRILDKHNLIEAINKGDYGAVYFLSGFMSQNYKEFGQIWKRFGKK